MFPVFTGDYWVKLITFTVEMTVPRVSAADVR